MKVPELWRNQRQRYRLEGSCCGKCGEVFFPGTGVCPECRNRGQGEDLGTRYTLPVTSEVEMKDGVERR